VAEVKSPFPPSPAKKIISPPTNNNSPRNILATSFPDASR
jgi:hypothetical protein